METNHYSPLYRTLRATDAADFQRIIRQYEEREQEIGRLDVGEYFELTVSYVDALFATGAYGRHLLMVDLVIQASIEYDLRRAPGVSGDVFEHMLFRKAASAYQLRDFATAAYVAGELVRINPRRPIYRRFLRAALFQRRVPVLQFGRAAFILGVLTTAALLTANLLVVRSFYPQWAGVLHAAAAVSLLLGLAVLVGAYALAFCGAHRAAGRFQREAENKRRSDS